MHRIPVLALFALGCADMGGSPADNPVPREVTDGAGEVGRVVDGTNAFTFDVYGEVAEGVEGNVFLSPFSLSAALSMTMAGADGVTLAEMQEVLGATGDASTWHPAFGALIRDLDGDYDRAYTLSIANRIFGAPDYPWSEAFLSVCESDYGAPLESTDFAADPEAARTRINDWVLEKTNDRIEELLPGGSITSNTRMVLANAIYFLAQWDTPFDPEDTSDLDFTRLDGTTVTAPIMMMETKQLEEHGLSMGFIEGGTVVRLPYGGDEVSMIVVVPDEADGLPALEAGLTAEVFDGWLGELGNPGADLMLRMPRFEIELEVDGIPLLTELGMPSLFGAADLSAMTDPPGNGLAVSGVFHKAFVKVDEAGTEAAAASAVVVNESAPPFVDATHPFLFAIRDDLTGTVLFVGRVMDPTAG